MTLLDHAYWSLTLTAISALAIGAFVLWKNPRHLTNRTFTFFNICIGIWSFGQSRIILTSDPEVAMLLSRLMHVGIVLIATTYYHFVVALVGIASRRTVALRACYAFSCLFLALVPSALFLEQPMPKFYFLNYASPGPLYGPVFLSVWMGIVIWALIELFHGYQRAHEAKRNQLKYAFVAFVIGFSGGVSSYAWLFGWDPYPWTPYGTYGVALYPMILAYAILKHQLMDINVVVRKSMIYSILVALLTATYFMFVFVAEKLLQGVMGYQTWAPSLLAAFVIALGFTPVRNWVQSFVDRYFFKGTQVAIAAENEHLRQELQQAEKQKAISLFASGMAHEIKNPLAALKTFAEYLPEKYDEPAFRAKFARIVGQEVGRIQGIVQRLLDFAKPTPPHLQAVTVSQVLEDTLSFLQADMVGKRLQLTHDHHPSDTVQADPAQLKQVFLNLLLNAIEATPHGGRITTALQPNGQYLHVTIADTGCGMDATALARAGEPFFTTKPTGTGLGLAVVRGIVEQHHGKLAIESVNGQGTSVKIQLPIPSNPTYSHEPVSN